MDPRDAGADLPPTGRSLFDFLVTERAGDVKVYKVPFPFTTLTRAIEDQLGGATQPSPLKRVLIPLNRSLQRNAARPDFFAYPRAVLAVDTEPKSRSGHSGMFLKDRLFLGYHERAGIIEVISYNEAAGRFEFQVVKDYRPGGAPRVFYANRALCVVCHQNHGPMFARQMWDETNANLEIGARLRAQARPFYGFPLDQGVDIPYAIDNATDRANGFSAAQRLWQEGCEAGASEGASIQCRAGVFTLLLQYRLGGSRQVDSRSPAYRERFAPVVARRWQERWPHGLAIPNPDIPNRDPLASSSGGSGSMSLLAALTRAERTPPGDLVKQSNVHARFDPATPRPPAEIWSVSARDPRGVDRVITGLSSFLPEADIHRLDRHLFTTGRRAKARETRYQSVCEFAPRHRERSIDRLTFRCREPESAARGSGGHFAMEGLIYLDGGTVTSGAVDRVAIDGSDELRDVEVVGGEIKSTKDGWVGHLDVVQRHSGLHVRRLDGSAITHVRLRGEALGRSGSAATGESVQDVRSGTASMTIMDDFAPVHAAVARVVSLADLGRLDVFSAKPFRRASLMKALYGELGMAPPEWCCMDDAGMPPARVEGDPSADDVSGTGADRPDQQVVRLFDWYCARCHRSADAFPPNFLSGQAARIHSSLAHCAERIFFRLSMWRLRPEERPKTPMPPINAFRELNILPEQWPSHAGLQALTEHVAGILRSQTGTAPRLEDLMARNYEELRACLPREARP